jgi:hypothetical protein
MFTIFTCPKPFRGHSNIIQRNAIRSWTLLRPKPQIILVGNDEGTVDICEEFGICHIPQVQRNEFETPVLNSIFSQAEKAAKHQLMCYINADIILTAEFSAAAQKITGKISRCLIVGQRWDVDVSEPVDFSDGWEQNLKAAVKKNGRLHGHTGIDFFIFNKGLFGEVLPFALGRTMWDNWLIYKIRSQKIPVVDVTDATTVIHQNHNYSHLKDGNLWKGREAKQNLALAGGYGYAFSILNASHKLTPTGLKRNLSLSRLYYETNRLVRRSLKTI